MLQFIAFMSYMMEQKVPDFARQTLRTCRSSQLKHLLIRLLRISS